VPRSELSEEKPLPFGHRVRRPRKNGLRLIANFNVADDMAYKASAKIEIEKYSVWNEKKAVQIGFTKVALGKFIEQNDEVMYFTWYDVRRIILAYKCISSGPCASAGKHLRASHDWFWFYL